MDSSESCLDVSADGLLSVATGHRVNDCEVVPLHPANVCVGDENDCCTDSVPVRVSWAVVGRTGEVGPHGRAGVVPLRDDGGAEGCTLTDGGTLVPYTVDRMARKFVAVCHLDSS